MLDSLGYWLRKYRNIPVLVLLNVLPRITVPLFVYAVFLSTPRQFKRFNRISGNHAHKPLFLFYLWLQILQVWVHLMKVQRLLLIAHALRLKRAHQRRQTNNKNKSSSNNNSSSCFTNITILSFNNNSNVRPEVRQPLHRTLLRTVEPPVRCGGHHRKIKVSPCAVNTFMLSFFFFSPLFFSSKYEKIFHNPNATFA